VFDQLVVTDDDRLRADRYSQERRRQELRRAESYGEFLRRCATEVDIEPLRDAGVERAAQLAVRTTQFNLTGERLGVADLRGGIGTGDAWIVKVRDRFGDYGTVGLILTDQALDDEALSVRQLLMSCRVLNRGVEQAIVRFLVGQARHTGRRLVRLPFRPSARNTPARLFLEALGQRTLAGETTVEIGV
jgi:FkbH-like protein